jgi:hypothetical protein
MLSVLHRGYRAAAPMLNRSMGSGLRRNDEVVV